MQQFLLLLKHNLLESKLELILTSSFKLICQIKLCQLSFINDI
jgi:hypothetical protein